MAEGSGKAQDISLENESDAVVRYGGTTVELYADGNIVVNSNGDVTVHTNGNVKLRPADDEKEATFRLRRIGDRMPDGTVYAGISPDTSKPMYTTPAYAG